jgi:ribosome-associated toxin RatA of RatAB toxin-antitoxin module
MTMGKKHFERKLINQPIATLYEVVSDVDRYKEFVPWCKESRVISKTGRNMTAELEVGFNIFSEKYTSKIETIEPTFVSAMSTETNLFEYLKTEWKFTPASDPKATWVTFQVEFKFRSAMYNELSRLFLQEVVAKMVKAFEQRCKTVQIEHKEAVKYSAGAC